MSDSRINISMDPELEPERLEDRRDLNAQIDVAVDVRLTRLSVFGVVLLAVGIAAVLLGSVVFALNFPHNWYASSTDIAHFDTTRAVIKAVLISFGVGVISLLLGASAFFHGRAVLGSGHLDQFTTEQLEVTH